MPILLGSDVSERSHGLLTKPRFFLALAVRELILVAVGIATKNWLLGLIALAFAIQLLSKSRE